MIAKMKVSSWNDGKKTWMELVIEFELAKREEHFLMKMFLK